MRKKLKYPYLVGSKWTARTAIDGWRHFEVVNRKNQGNWVFAEVIAVCDSTVRFWTNAKNLNDSNLWIAGWVSSDSKS